MNSQERLDIDEIFAEELSEKIRESPEGYVTEEAPQEETKDTIDLTIKQHIENFSNSMVDMMNELFSGENFFTVIKKNTLPRDKQGNLRGYPRFLYIGVLFLVLAILFQPFS